MAPRRRTDEDYPDGFDPAKLPLPSNIEAEQALLGCILINADAYGRVSGFLRREHFREPIHGVIFEVAGQMVALRKPVTPGTIRVYLPAGMEVGDLSLPQYLARLAAEATTIINAYDYGRIVVDMAHRRELVAIAQDLLVDAKVTDRRVDVGPVVEAAASRLFDIGADLASLASSDRETDEDYFDVAAAAQDRLEHGVHAVAGISSGLLSLDSKVPGLMAGDFVIVAGRPSMGKSILGLNIAARAAGRGDGALFDSYELTGRQVRSRLMSDWLEKQGHRVPYKDIDRGRITPDQVGLLQDAAAALDAYPLVIADSGNRLDQIPGKIREARRKLERVGRELKLYVGDYLGLVKPTDRYRGNKVHEVGELSASIKALAKQEGVPMVFLHQLSRASEGRKDRRPTLSDLRDTGNLEQDADVVMFVYRDAYYFERPGYGEDSDVERATMAEELAHDLEIIIAKQRQGPVGTVRCWIDIALNAVRDRQWT